MKRESRLVTIPGRCMGLRIRIRTFIRASTADCSAPADQLIWGDHNPVPLNGDLNPKMHRLLPIGYMTSAAKAGQWEAFVRAGIMCGAIR